jgi:hypothetical protein
MRTLAEILDYDFEIEYLPGAQNYIQDTLSHCRDYKESPIPVAKVVISLDSRETAMALELV